MDLPELNSPALSLDDAALLLNCSRRTIEREIKDGRLTSVKMGNRRRILAGDLKGYLQRHRNEPDDDGAFESGEQARRLVDGVCAIHCHQHAVDSIKGVALFPLGGVTMSACCPHVVELSGLTPEELLAGQWWQWPEMADAIPEASLEPRFDGERYVVVRFPIVTATGDTVEVDVLNEPVFNRAGELDSYLAVLAAPGRNCWRSLTRGRVIE